MKLTARCIRITHERAVRLKAVVEQIKQGPMTRAEIELLIGLTTSGCTKYMEDLLDNKIIVRIRVDGEHENVTQLYRVSDNAAHVDEFVRVIMLPGLDGMPRHRGRNISAEDGMRQVHIVKDDEPVKVKLEPAKPPKQIDLVLYLFGMVPA